MIQLSVFYIDVLKLQYREKYLTFLSHQNRIIFTKFRTTNHKLPI